MEFRWIALIALWTLLAGPLFNAGVSPREPRAQVAAKPAKVVNSSARH